MPHRTPLLLLALAAALWLPAAAALAAGPGEPLPLQPVPPQPAAPAIPPLPPVGASLPLKGDGVAGVVQADLDGEVAVRVLLPAVPGDSAGPAQPASGQVATQSALGERIAQAAVPVAAGSALAFLAGALAFGFEGLRSRAAGLLAQLGRALAGLLPTVALFSRIERGALLDNPVRARVHDAIAQDPGLSLSEVRLRTGIAWGTAVHHLRRLEDHGMVVSISQKAHRRYFAANTPAASQRAAMAAVLHPTARRIAQLVSQRPGIDQTGICRALGLNNPAASKHLREFEAQGLVLSAREGNSRTYQPTDALHSALLLLEPAPTQLVARPRPPALAVQGCAQAC